MENDKQSSNTVTVVIPAYNAARTLNRAVKSAVDQTYKAIEIIIIDDASTDDTQSIAAKIALQEPRVKVVSLSGNVGLAGARNAGIDEARGEYIAPLDADDEWLPEKLEKQIAVFRNDPSGNVGIVASDSVDIDESSGEQTLKVTPQYDDPFFAALALERIASADSVLIPRKAMLEAGKYDEKLRHQEDCDLWPRLLKNYDFANVSEPLLRRYIHGDNMTLTTPKDNVRQAVYYIFDKHRDIYRHDAVKRSELRRRWGSIMQKKFDDSRAARREFAESITANPKNWKSYIGYAVALTGLSGLHRLLGDINLARKRLEKKI